MQRFPFRIDLRNKQPLLPRGDAAQHSVLHNRHSAILWVALKCDPTPLVAQHTFNCRLLTVNYQLYLTIWYVTFWYVAFWYVTSWYGNAICIREAGRGR